MKKIKISFDFDGTLSDKESVRNLVKILLNSFDRECEVHITTSRTTKWNNNGDLFHVAESLNIPKERIHFTMLKDKFHFLEGFSFHIDDDEIELDLINSNIPGCTGIQVLSPNFIWKFARLFCKLI